MATQHSERESIRSQPTQGIVDFDVHNATRERAELLPYLEERWHPYLSQGVTTLPQEALFVGARPMAHIFRRDSLPGRGIPGSDLTLLQDQLLDGYNVACAVLHPVSDFAMLPVAGEHGQALMAALNDWMVDAWLEQDTRLRGAISVPIEDGLRAAEEIERCAGDPRFVKVTLMAKTREGLGHPKYWPIYEAAVAHHLPVSIHVGGFSGSATAAGWPTYFVEYQLGHQIDLQAQLASLVCSGVFARYPDLQVVMEEGGIGWIAPLLWRLDRAWRRMHAEAGRVERLPSEIAREHLWVTTQPLDQPTVARHLADVFEQLDMADRVLFATDYPHWNFDDPARVLPKAVLGDELRDKVLHENAKNLLAWRERAAA